jgi:2-polyprenyl-6-methoxyphenol hydroxylase-like FAD-dependent oxidoreductase
MTGLRGDGQVLIVGAGPGGAVLAYLFARTGIRTTLIEHHTDFSRAFRGELLMPGGLEPFHQMGLWEQLDAVPHRKIGRFTIFVNAKHTLGLELPETVFNDYGPRWISQPDLLEMLVAEAAQSATFTLLRGATVRDLVRHDKRVIGVRLSDGVATQELRGAFVIGADGRNSTVRKRANVPVRQDSTPMDIVWIKIPQPESLERSMDGEFRAYVGGGRLLIVAPTPDGKLQLGWIIPKGNFGDIRSRGVPRLMDEIANLLDPDLRKHIRRHRETPAKPVLLSTVSDHVQRWDAPGMLLIGDAAHTMSPVGAQGLNMAIRDAVVTANHLGPILRAGAEPTALDAAARAVQAERTNEIVTIQKIQARPPKVILNNTWWTRLLLRSLPHLARGVIGQARNRGLFGRFAWGVSDVRLGQ